MPANPITACRVCQGTDLLPWLDLGSQPPANAFHKPEDPAPPRYPLIVNRCQQCHHSQLSVRVNPKELYAEYPYRSGVSETFARHCDELAALCRRLSKGGERILDIGCNDGTLLKAFWRLGLNPHQLVGVDPTSDADVPFPVVRGFFPDVWLPHGSYDVILTLNTLNAVDDLRGFVARVADLLTPLGVWVIEVPYLVNLIRGLAVDTLYHEHLGYFLVGPLLKLLEPHGLRPVAIFRRGMHAGSIRIVVGRSDIAEVGQDWAWWEETAGYYDAYLYRRFRHEIDRSRSKFSTFKAAHPGKWAGVGAPAKLTVFSALFDITPDDIPMVADETPQKQGTLSPTGFRVVTPEQLREYRPDYVLCFAWNFWQEILPKVRAWCPSATMVVALPEVTAHR